MSAKNIVMTLLVVTLGAAGCSAADPSPTEEVIGVAAEPVTQSECDAMTPFPGCTTGPGPINAKTCDQNWWPKSQPGGGTLCFGRTCDIDNENNRRKQCGAPQCHYLAMPSTGPDRWTECKNELFLECSLRGLIPGIGKSIIVTPPGGAPGSSWAGNEICYVWKKHHIWPKYVPHATPAGSANTLSVPGIRDDLTAQPTCTDAMPLEQPGPLSPVYDTSDDPGTPVDFGSEAAEACVAVD